MTKQQFTFTIDLPTMLDAQNAFNEALSVLQKHGTVAYRIKTLGDDE